MDTLAVRESPEGYSLIWDTLSPRNWVSRTRSEGAEGAPKFVVQVRWVTALLMPLGEHSYQGWVPPPGRSQSATFPSHP